MRKALVVAAILIVAFVSLARASARPSHREVELDELYERINTELYHTERVIVSMAIIDGCPESQYAVPPWTPGIMCANRGVSVGDAYALTGTTAGEGVVTRVSLRYFLSGLVGN